MSSAASNRSSFDSSNCTSDDDEDEDEEMSLPVVVALRLKPNPDNLPTSLQADCADNTVTLATSKEDGSEAFSTHQFNYVFSSSASQDTVFSAAVSQFVPLVLDGYDLTLLAHGQSGSGKTHTIFGPDLPNATSEADFGLVVRLTRELFHQMLQRQQREKDYRFNVRATFMDIEDDDEASDVLSQSSDGQQIFLSRNDPRSSSVQVNGLTSIDCLTVDDVVTCVERGLSLHKVRAELSGQILPPELTRGSTHSIFTLHVKQQQVLDDNGLHRTVESTVRFVDLAGADQLILNRGLLSLSNVVAALGDARRNAYDKACPGLSLLTQVLADSFGGRALTVLLCCVSPLLVDAEETENSVRFCRMAANVVNRPRHRVAVMDSKSWTIPPTISHPANLCGGSSSSSNLVFSDKGPLYNHNLQQVTYNNLGVVTPQTQEQQLVFYHQMQLSKPFARSNSQMCAPSFLPKPSPTNQILPMPMKPMVSLSLSSKLGNLESELSQRLCPTDDVSLALSQRSDDMSLATRHSTSTIGDSKNGSESIVVLGSKEKDEGRGSPCDTGQSKKALDDSDGGLQEDLVVMQKGTRGIVDSLQRNFYITKDFPNIEATSKRLSNIHICQPARHRTPNVILGKERLAQHGPDGCDVKDENSGNILLVPTATALLQNATRDKHTGSLERLQRNSNKDDVVRLGHGRSTRNVSCQTDALPGCEINIMSAETHRKGCKALYTVQDHLLRRLSDLCKVETELRKIDEKLQQAKDREEHGTEDRNKIALALQRNKEKRVPYYELVGCLDGAIEHKNELLCGRRRPSAVPARLSLYESCLSEIMSALSPEECHDLVRRLLSRSVNLMVQSDSADTMIGNLEHKCDKYKRHCLTLSRGLEGAIAEQERLRKKNGDILEAYRLLHDFYREHKDCPTVEGTLGTDADNGGISVTRHRR